MARDCAGLRRVVANLFARLQAAPCRARYQLGAARRQHARHSAAPRRTLPNQAATPQAAKSKLAAR